MKISGFTFVHNALEGGYPIVQAVRAVQPFVDEVIVVDMESDDGTFKVLRQLGARIMTSPWSRKGDDTLIEAFELHFLCEGDTVIFFEADEVYDDRLLRNIRRALDEGHAEIAVHRLQLEQNFQRCRWHPYPVRRVVQKGFTRYVPSQMADIGDAHLLPPSSGLLWDVCNCFRDNWFRRIENQSELWGEPRYRMVPRHFLEPVEMTAEAAASRLQEEHWTWKTTPFAIPEILKPLVGMTKYEARLQ